MKVCNTEAMKTIKEYEEQKRILLMHETDSYTVMYKEGETAVKGDYDYAKTRKEIQSSTIRSDISAHSSQRRIAR